PLSLHDALPICRLPATERRDRETREPRRAVCRSPRLANPEPRIPNPESRIPSYCLSYTATLLIVRPFSSLPRVVTVIVFPSAEILRVTVWTVLPSFLRVCSVVLSSTRFIAAVS